MTTKIARAVARTLRAHGGRVRGYDDGGDVLPDVGQPLIGSGGQFSRGTRMGNLLAGLQPGEPRFQLWPEKMVRSGVSLAHDVMTGKQPMLPIGLRREDFTTDPAPSGPTEDSTWLGRKLGLPPVAAGPHDEVLERVQDMAGLAGGQTLMTGRKTAHNIRETQHVPTETAAVREAPVDVAGGLAGAPGGDASLRAAQLQAQRWAGDRAAVEGLPVKPQIVDGDWLIPGPVAKAHDVAEAYMQGRDYGVPHPDRYHPIDVDHAKRIAQAFEEMQHNPRNPEVKAAYEALARETLDQYRAIREHGGLQVTPVNAADYPYHGNPRAVVKDVADNNHMAFFKTDEGFGTNFHADPDHPLLKSSGEKVGGHDMLFNDLFRVVHDYFGHVKNGNGFRGAGEDNAWRSHAAMYSPLARRAMTTETRGQNSWLNYGPHGEKNRTANAADTIYADQKIGLMPEWTMHDAGWNPTLMADSQAVGAPLSALEHAPAFYSGLGRTVEGVQQPKMTGAQWLATLSNKGAKAEELQWTGLADFLKEKSEQKPGANAPPPQVTKEEVLKHLADNEIKLGATHLGEMQFNKDSKYALPKVIEAARRAGDNPGELELVLANDGDAYRALTKKFPELAENEDWASVVANDVFGGDTMPAGSTKHHDYQLPGGENYREKLLTLRQKGITPEELIRRDGSLNVNNKGELAPTYMSSHWDEPNVLVHRRSNERSFPEPLTEQQLAAVEARRAAQGQLNGLRQQENITARKIMDLSQQLEGARNYNIRADLKEGKITPLQARKAMEEYVAHPQLVPLQEKLQALRAQQDAVTKAMPEEPKPNSKSSLHLEEIQSDWHQQGRKKGYGKPDPSKFKAEPTQFAPGMRGFRVTDAGGAFIADLNAPSAEAALAHAREHFSDGVSGRVPDAPFKKNWHELALKDAIREAAEKGMDRISWTPGEAQAARYDLSKQVRRVLYRPESKELMAWPKAGAADVEPIMHHQNVSPEKLADYIGKEAADRILKQKPDSSGAHILSGVDLKVGGEGMKGFYDKIIPDYLNKLGKPHGVKVQTTNLKVNKSRPTQHANWEDWIKAEQEGVPVHYMDIPQSLKDEALKKGFSLFEDSASVGAPLAALEKSRARRASPNFAEGGGVGDDYNTRVNEALFQVWKTANAPRDSGVDYDLRGAYQAGVQRAEDGHMTDQFKKPNHPTFSDQSQYAVGDQRARAGHWVGETFVPPPLLARGGRAKPAFDPTKSLDKPPFDPSKPFS